MALLQENADAATWLDTVGNENSLQQPLPCQHSSLVSELKVDITVSKGTTHQPQQQLRPGSLLQDRGSSGSSAHAERTGQQTAAADAKLNSLQSFAYTGRRVYGALGQNASDPFRGLTAMTNLIHLQLEDVTPASIANLPRFVPHLQSAVDVTEPLMERLTSFLLLSPPDPLDLSSLQELKDLELVVFTHPSVRVYEGVAVNLPSQLTCLEILGPVDDVCIATTSCCTSATVPGSVCVAGHCRPAAATAAASAASEEDRPDQGVFPVLSMLNVLGGKIPMTCISKLIKSAPQLRALRSDGFTESQSYAENRLHGSMTDSESVSSSGEYVDLDPMLLWPAQAQQLTAAVAAASGLTSLCIQGFGLRSDPHQSVVQWGQAVCEAADQSVGSAIHRHS